MGGREGGGRSAHGFFSLVLLTSSVRFLDGQEELELGGELLLSVELVGEVDAPDAAVGVNLHPQRLNIVCPCTCSVNWYRQPQHSTIHSSTLGTSTPTKYGKVRCLGHYNPNKVQHIILL